jgi:DNA-binding MarR family transcriptional regulator
MSELRQPVAANDRETAAHRDDKLELRLWLRLLTCSSLIEQNVRSALRLQFDTTLPRFDLMAQLDRAPDGLTMSELSARMMVSNGNITGLADRLVEEGLVKRTPSPRDRRSSHISLTPAGKKAFDAMTPVHEGWTDRMMNGLSRQDMQQLFQLLGKLKQSVHQNAVETDRGETK